MAKTKKVTEEEGQAMVDDTAAKLLSQDSLEAQGAAADADAPAPEPEPVGPPPAYAGVMPGIGDEVFYVIDQGPHVGEDRPAFVVAVLDDYDGVLDLQVLTRGHADNQRDVVLRSNVRPGEARGQWHVFMPKV